jgi:hypothetical protein
VRSGAVRLVLAAKSGGFWPGCFFFCEEGFVRFFPGCGFVIRSALLVNSPVPNFLLDELWLEFMISLLEFLPLYMLCSNGCPEAKRKNWFGIIRACEIAVFLRQLSCTVVPKQFLSNFFPRPVAVERT